MATETTNHVDIEAAELPRTVMLCFDDNSFGVFPFPISASEVEVAPGTPMQMVRPAQLADGVLKVDGPVSMVRPGARVNRALQSQIHSWMRVAPDVAFMALTQATPGFWLNRFRRTSEGECLLKDVNAQLNLEKVLAARGSIRRRLAEHSVSLTSKF